MAEKIPWKPEQSHLQRFLRDQENPVSKKTNHQEVSNDTKLEILKPDIWEQRAIWIFVGIFITIVILWLANNSSDQGVSEDCYNVPDRGGIIECE